MHIELKRFSQFRSSLYETIHSPERLPAPCHACAKPAESVAEVYNSQAGNYWFKGDYERAFEISNAALSIWQETLDEQHPTLAKSFGNIASISAEKGDYNKAIEFFEKSLALKIAKLGEEHRQFANGDCLVRKPSHSRKRLVVQRQGAPAAPATGCGKSCSAKCGLDRGQSSR